MWGAVKPRGVRVNTFPLSVFALPMNSTKTSKNFLIVSILLILESKTIFFQFCSCHQKSWTLWARGNHTCKNQPKKKKIQIFPANGF